MYQLAHFTCSFLHSQYATCPKTQNDRWRFLGRKLHAGRGGLTEGWFLRDDGRGPTEAQHSSMEGRKPCWVVIFLQHQEDLHMDKAWWTPRKMIQWMKYDIQFMKHDLMIQASMYFDVSWYLMIISCMNKIQRYSHFHCLKVYGVFHSRVFGYTNVMEWMRLN